MIPLPKLKCKICRKKIYVFTSNLTLAEMGMIIAQCHSRHYTIHMLKNDESFTDFIFLNGFEVQRSYDPKLGSQTIVFRGHEKILGFDRAITDKEFLDLYNRFDRLSPFT